MPKDGVSSDDRRFQSLVHHYYEGEQIDPILGAANHPLLIRASRYIVRGEFLKSMNDADYIEALAVIGEEFDLSPDEVNVAMEISEERAARE